MSLPRLSAGRTTCRPCLDSPQPAGGRGRWSRFAYPVVRARETPVRFMRGVTTAKIPRRGDRKYDRPQQTALAEHRPRSTATLPTWLDRGGKISVGFRHSSPRGLAAFERRCLLIESPQGTSRRRPIIVLRRRHHDQIAVGSQHFRAVPKSLNLWRRLMSGWLPHERRQGTCTEHRHASDKCKVARADHHRLSSLAQVPLKLGSKDLRRSFAASVGSA